MGGKEAIADTAQQVWFEVNKEEDLSIEDLALQEPSREDSEV
jgi:hypothetical protein